MKTNQTATDACASIALAVGIPADEALFLQTVPFRILAAIAAGEVDVPMMARETLAARGVDRDGRWVGFPRAAEIHHVR